MANCDIIIDVELLEETYDGLMEDPVVTMGRGDPYTGPTTVTPAQTSQVLNTADFFMLNDVVVEAIPSKYIDTRDATLVSGDQMLQGVTAYADNTKYTGTIVTKGARNITALGSVITVPSGYYATDVTKEITLAHSSLYVSPISVDSTGQVNYTAIASGYFYTQESASCNVQLATQSGITLIPGATSYVGVESCRYTTGEISVAAIRSDYVGGGVPRRDANDLEIADNAITVPSGYYAAAVSHALPSGTGDEAHFMVNLLYDEENNSWQPECAFEEIETAYNSGKQLIATTSYSNQLVSGMMWDSKYSYTAIWDDYQYIDEEFTSVKQEGFYSFDSSGNSLDFSQTFIRLPTDTKSITANGSYDITKYAKANVEIPVGTVAFSTNIIDATPTFSINSFTGVVTATIGTASNVSLNVVPGYISAGTSGLISITGTASEQLVTKAAASYTPTTYDQTITAGQYLTGTQTIAGDSNLVANNIKAGTSIFGVIGNYNGLNRSHTATITNRSQNLSYSSVKYNGQTYKNLNDSFTFQTGDTLIIEADSRLGGGKIYINDDLVASDNTNKVTYNYILPDYDISIVLFEYNSEAEVYIFTSYIVISENSKYDVSDYSYAYVEVAYASQSFYESIPIFTIEHTNHEDISCNKTYSECWNQIAVNGTAIIDHHYYGSNHRYTGAIGESDDDYIQYGPAMPSFDSEDNFIGWYDIYWANGSDITLIPSMFQQN